MNLHVGPSVISLLCVAPLSTAMQKLLSQLSVLQEELLYICKYRFGMCVGGSSFTSRTLNFEMTIRLLSEDVKWQLDLTAWRTGSKSTGALLGVISHCSKNYKIWEELASP